MPKDPERAAMLLDISTTTPERIEGILACGLTEGQIGLACGVSSNLVARWGRGESVPQPRQKIRLSDLRSLCLLAIEISRYRLGIAGKLLINLKVPELLARGHFSDAEIALYNLRSRRSTVG